MKATRPCVLSAWLIKRSSDQCRRCFRTGPDKRPRRPPLHVQPVIHEEARPSPRHTVTCLVGEWWAAKRLPRQPGVIVLWAVSPSFAAFFFFFAGTFKTNRPTAEQQSSSSSQVQSTLHLSYQIYASSCFNWFSQYSFICLFALLAAGLLPNGFFVLFCCLLFDATANKSCRLILSP